MSITDCLRKCLWLISFLMFALLRLAREACLCNLELVLRIHLNCNVIDLLLCTGMYYSLACLCFCPPPTTQWISWSTLLQTTHDLPASCSSLHVPADIRRCTCSRTQWTQLFPVLRHNTVQPWLSFRHRACYRVIALLINVSPSQDNGLVFTVRFSRLAMRDIQWCNLLSVYYALRGSPLGTLFPGSSQDTHLSMYLF